MKCHAFHIICSFYTCWIMRINTQQILRNGIHLFFKFLKMRRIPFVQLSILLITMIGIANYVSGMNNYEKLKMPLIEKEDDSDQFKFEVIEDDTTEEEDMEKAVALRKTVYWRLMMAKKWNCDQKELKRVKEIGFENATELLQFCGQWKIMAIAANAYVKSWEKSRKGQKQGDEVGTSSSSAQKTRKTKEKENPLECNFVKPIFQIENRELQMNSALEAIKAVFRDLFLWGKGKGLNSLKTMIQFANEEEVVVSGCLSERMECPNPDENIEELYKEKLNETSKQIKIFLSVDLIKILKKLFLKQTIEEWRKYYNIFLNIWKLAEEIGLDFAQICDAAKKSFLFYSYLPKPEGNIVTDQIDHEKMLGLIFIDYKEEYDKMQKKKDVKLNEIFEKMPKNDAKTKEMSAEVQKNNDEVKMKELEKLMSKDPCEQAKLKLKKN